MNSYPPYVDWLIRKLILESLRVEDARLNEMSAELCKQLGPEMSWRLVGVIARVNCEPAHRVRVARVLERIGAIEEPTNLDVLKNVFCTDEHAEVRDAVGRVIVVLRGGQPDDMSAEEISTFVLEDRGSMPATGPLASAEQDGLNDLALQLKTLEHRRGGKNSRRSIKEQERMFKATVAVMKSAERLRKSME